MKLTAPAIARMPDADLDRAERIARDTVKRYAGSRRMGHSRPDAALADRALALIGREKRRRAGKRHVAACLENNARSHSDAEQCAAAVALGRPEYAPAAQAVLPMVAAE